MSSSNQLISGASATNSSQVVGTVHGSVYFGDNESSLLHRLPYAHEALFNSYNKRHEPCCLPNTRVDLLQEIYGWVEGHHEQFIFWLNGLAGTGKSTIARTVARKYFENGQLGASFFFSRGGGDVGHASKFFTTIALQLSTRSQSLQRHIYDALRKNSNIPTQSLGDQWRQLVLGPLSKLCSDSYIPFCIVVIDALDECDNDEDIRIILQLLAEARSLGTVRLRVLVTIRPETTIRHGFYQIPEAEHRDFVLHNISPSVVDHDITIYLEYNLSVIREERFLVVGWPGEEAIRRLVENASGLFIWVATACRFIREGKQFTAKRLAMILGNSSYATTAPEKQLNGNYLTVLKHSVSPDYDTEEVKELLGMVRYILGSVVILSTPLSAYSLSKLLNLSQEKVEQTLDDLHPILEVPKDQTQSLRLHHPSFRDFLLDKNRCDDSNFWVDEKQAHGTLARDCIQLLSTTLKEDICGVTKPGMFIDEVQSSRVEQCLPLEVQYACLYWVDHLQKSDAQLRDYEDVHQFLRNRFLYWLEALSWMRKISDGIHKIIVLESIANVTYYPNLHAYIHDMKRFALYNRAVLEQAPLQLYCSALLFAPAMTMVRRQFTNKMARWIKRGPQVRMDWSSVLQILEGHSRSIEAVVYSPNGKLLASSGSGDKTVRLWDAGTCATLQILEGHLSSVNTIIFSPDSKQLASGSWDKTVRVWDAATGVMLRIIRGHSDFVNAVAFSPAGMLLVSGSRDKTVRVWHTVTGATLHILEGHSGSVDAVVFSADGKQLTSGSSDCTVRVWDTATGATLQVLQGHSYLAFSPDGKHVASGSDDEKVRIWDIATGAMLQVLDDNPDLSLATAFSPDGTLLASGCLGSSIWVWDIGTGATRKILHRHSDFVTAVAFSPDGKQIASGSIDETIRVWELTTSDSWDTTIRGKVRTAWAISDQYSDEINTVAISPDCRYLASASEVGIVRVWDAATGMPLKILEDHIYQRHVIAYSPDGKLLATGSNDKTLRVWDVVTGAMLQAFNCPSRFVSALAFSPDSTQLAAAVSVELGRRSVWILDTTTETTLQVLEDHTELIEAVAFSPDSKQLVASLRDKTVRLWNLVTAELLQIFELDIVVRSLYYRRDGSIMTDHGRLDVTAPRDQIALSSVASLTPLGLSVFRGNNWIGYGNDRMLWLPPDYRPSCSAVRENIVCLGHDSGRVSMFEFRCPP